MSEESPTPESSSPEIPPVQAASPAPAPVSPDPAAAAPPAAVPQVEISKEQKDKKLIAGILAIMLGSLGIHKFFLGYQKEGIIMLVVTIAGTIALCGVPVAAFVVGTIGLIEGILYLTKTDEEFVSTYLVGRKPWF